MEFPLGQIDIPTNYPRLEEFTKLKPKPISYDPCSCVSYARWKTGINVGSIGVARNHPINSQIPKENAIVVMNSKYPAGHLAVVAEINQDTITITESNATPCKVTSRTLPKNSELIKGYFIQ